MHDSEAERFIKMDEAEFDQYMCKTYPVIFRNRHKPMSQTAMCWGFAIGPGWRPLLVDLCDKLNCLMKIVGGYEIIADQVKEKYGVLRFYWHGEGDDDHTLPFEPPDRILYDIISDLVGSTEQKSGHVCEECGQHGCMSKRDSWLATKCKKHAKEGGFEYGEDLPKKSL